MSNETSLSPTKEDKLISEATPEGKAFALMQRKAVALSQTDFIPNEFKGNVAKCIIALELSERIGCTALAVTQNMYEVYGKPSWSSSFVISCINSIGRFPKGLRFEWFGEKGTDGRGCFAWAKDEDGDRVEGPSVTFAMAKAEGWVSKKGSKWMTIPELMTMYRAATFFGRLYTPEVMNGMHTMDELQDIGPRSGFENARSVNPHELPDPPSALKPASEVATDATTEGGES